MVYLSLTNKQFEFLKTFLIRRSLSSHLTLQGEVKRVVELLERIQDEVAIDGR